MWIWVVVGLLVLVPGLFLTLVLQRARVASDDRSRA